jgi:enoyl-CoA hydratase/carnithine racemase
MGSKPGAEGFQDVLYRDAGGTATITINRPEKRNALRKQTWEDLLGAIRIAEQDPEVRCVVITGAGDKAFSAGGDIEMAKEFRDNLPLARQHAFDRMLALSSAITNMDKPVIAAVNGIAVGGGAELLCFCDFVIAADHAVFWFNGTDLGGCSWWGAPQLLQLMVGLRRAEEILYLSRKFSAAEGAEWGFVNSSVPISRLAHEVGEYTDRLIGLSPNGVRLTKAALRSTRELLLASQNAMAEMNLPAMAGSELNKIFSAFGKT